jgi:glyoxylase-like metal-dependent hydrolase (beta-lactamase superfamily II)
LLAASFFDTIIIMKIEIIKTGDLETNSTIISQDGLCAIFDPDGNIDLWREMLDARGLKPVGIFLTHGHFDHVGAVADLTAEHNIKWHMSAEDIPMLKQSNMFGFLFGARRIKIPPMELFSALPDSGLNEILPNINAEIISTPGHTKGGVCFYFEKENLLISGDTLFADTIGRADLPFSNENDLLRSISELKNRNFPAHTRVIPGHSNESDIANIKIENPYF